jgi:hypothetical protein
MGIDRGNPMEEETTTNEHREVEYCLANRKEIIQRSILSGCK